MFGFKKPIQIDTNEAHVRNILTRGVEDILVKESLEKKLRSGTQLRIKLGIDPTGKTIHIGRAITLRKLRAFQDLGHQIVLIVGDFTAQVGDPSDKLEKRPMLTREKIEENLQNYKHIIGKIIDVSKAEFVFNSTWLKKLGFAEISELAESFTVQQMTARRNFKDRIDKGEEVSLREFLYPLMQGFDSVAVNADVEIGGFDQLFNLKAGRIIQKHYGKREQDILTTQMLEGTDGRKMSTSWGNVINITDDAYDMYGKVMSLRDDLIEKYFVLCTNLVEEDIAKIVEEIKGGANPAQKAEDNFINTFKKGGVPDDLTIVKVSKGTFLVDVLLKEGIIASKSEWKRLVIENGAKTVDPEGPIGDQFTKVEETTTYKIGKRRFIKIEVQ